MQPIPPPSLWGSGTVTAGSVCSCHWSNSTLVKFAVSAIAAPVVCSGQQWGKMVRAPLSTRILNPESWNSNPETRIPKTYGYIMVVFPPMTGSVLA